ncbi:MAG TPA: DUF333 domain-containing protein [Pseudacidobacterium sp.]|nr:DUF333 domain-containing protein [Pseudacidobacterium sp.]
MILRRNAYFCIAIVCIAVATQAQSKNTERTHLANTAKSMHALGTWQGTLPCADCSGIITTLTLYEKSPQDSKAIYRLHLKYIDRGSFTDYGYWTIQHGTADNQDAVIYQLNPDKPENTQYYLRVDNNTLQQLDREKKPIQSSLNFTLKLIDTQKVGMPNPASVNCTKHGGTLKTETGKDGGQVGICTFSNGKQCEEWAFFRGQCTSN